MFGECFVWFLSRMEPKGRIFSECAILLFHLVHSLTLDYNLGLLHYQYIKIRFLCKIPDFWPLFSLKPWAD